MSVFEVHDELRPFFFLPKQVDELIFVFLTRETLFYSG